MTDEERRIARELGFYQRVMPPEHRPQTAADLPPANVYLTGAYHRSARNASRRLIGLSALPDPLLELPEHHEYLVVTLIGDTYAHVIRREQLRMGHNPIFAVTKRTDGLRAAIEYNRYWRKKISGERDVLRSWALRDRDRHILEREAWVERAKAEGRWDNGTILISSLDPSYVHHPADRKFFGPCLVS